MSDDEEGGTCNVCGGPLRYGGRHRKCGEAVMAAVAAERERCAMRLEQAAAEYIASATDNKYLTDRGRALMTSASDWAQTMSGALRALAPAGEKT